jgi:hypothetical protein
MRGCARAAGRRLACFVRPLPPKPAAVPKPRHVFGIAFLACLPIAFVFDRYMEDAGHFDSVGLWYTLYGTVILSAVGASIIGVACWLWARFRLATDSGGRANGR